MAATSDVILSLGANRGDRRQNLESGLVRLRESGFSLENVSAVVESPAQLPPGSPSRWNRPYLNLVARGRTALDIQTFFRLSKQIQSELGRDPVESKWAPRDLDIDVVMWDCETVHVNGKTIPDPAVYLKPYVLSPLVHLSPDLVFPDADSKTVLELSCAGPNDFHVPLWMGIINVTPDSFSDGGTHTDLESIQASVQNMIEHGVNIVDIGAESTRPRATPLSAAEEWERLLPALKAVRETVGSELTAPKISVDTYHPETAELAILEGAEIINDVGGLGDGKMLAIARSSGRDFVAMHSVTVPVDPKDSLDPKSDACVIFEDWVHQQRRIWDAAGLDLSRIIVDPGIGFGKSSLQSLQLMRSAGRLRTLGHRLLIGHSRKSFLKTMTTRESRELDHETVGASLQLCSQSTDIIRVHDIAAHTRAYLSWAHLLRNIE